MVVQIGTVRNAAVFSAICFLLFFRVPQADGQELQKGGYTGHGIARIIEGDVAGARHKALVDAQGKAVMEAVASQLSIDEVKKYFLTLSNLFFSRPDVYLERFKIVSETALFDSYHVTIEGYVQQDTLKADLVSMGIVSSKQQAVKMLVMIAEKGLDAPEETYWWSSAIEPGSARYRSQDQLESNLRRKGAIILNPFDVSAPPVPYDALGDTLTPDVASLSQYASLLGARIVIIGKAGLMRAVEKKLSSIESVQCDMSVQVIDVLKKASVIQTTTYALGMHIDESAAITDAIDKACGNISGQIIDTLYMQMRSVHDYAFTIRFAKPVLQEGFDTFVSAMKASFPQMEFLETRKIDEKEEWKIHVQTPHESAAVLQRLYEKGVAGHAVEVLTVEEQNISLKVSPAEPGAAVSAQEQQDT